MKLKTVRLEDVRPYENNPRRNDGAVDAVAESIRQCGYVAPIVVDEEMVILAGHTRYKALTRLGHTTAKVLIAEGLNEEQKRKYRILDNKTGEIAEWDEDLLRGELEGLDFGGFDFGLLDLAAPEVESPEDVFEDEPPAPPQKPRTKRGELWQLGRHRVMCGDATFSADVQLLTGGGTDGYASHRPAIQCRLYRRHQGRSQNRKRLYGRRKVPHVFGSGSGRSRERHEAWCGFLCLAR